MAVEKFGVQYLASPPLPKSSICNVYHRRKKRIPLCYVMFSLSCLHRCADGGFGLKPIFGRTNLDGRPLYGVSYRLELPDWKYLGLQFERK
jgi:hypothetical protein